MKKKKNITKKALMSALALSIGTAAGGAAPVNASQDNLFSLKEVNSKGVIASKEGKCAGGVCGGKDATNAKESNCGEGKCGVSNIKKMLKKAKDKIQKKAHEATSVESKCGSKKKD